MLHFKGIRIDEVSYCKCPHQSSVTSESEEYGYWDVCCDCGKPLEDGFHYYNNYDGEDHDDIELY